MSDHTSLTLLTTARAAEMVDVSPRTLEGWRVSGSGPRFVRLNRQIRYRVSDLVTWVEANTVSSTSELAAGE